MIALIPTVKFGDGDGTELNCFPSCFSSTYTHKEKNFCLSLHVTRTKLKRKEKISKPHLGIFSRSSYVGKSINLLNLLTIVMSFNSNASKYQAENTVDKLFSNILHTSTTSKSVSKSKSKSKSKPKPISSTQLLVNQLQSTNTTANNNNTKRKNIIIINESIKHY